MREVANAFSQQAYRLDRALPAIVSSAHDRLLDPRAAEAVGVLAAKTSEVAHALVDCYRANRYVPMAVLVRTLLEDVSYLAWAGVPDAPEEQTKRMMRGVLDLFRRTRQNGEGLSPDMERLLRQTTGRAARKPPSFEDRLKILDQEEESRYGTPFWQTHRSHVALANDYVHSNFAGPLFREPRSHELLGFSTLAYGHQYFCLGAISAARMGGRNEIIGRFNRAYGKVVRQQRDRLTELIVRP